MKTLKSLTKYSAAVIAALGLTACNIDVGLDEETKAQLNRTVTGVLQSVEDFRVNSESYDISNASVTMDGQSADASQLQPGMVVSVSSVRNGNANQAVNVAYNDLVEGVIRSNQVNTSKTLDVMGQTVYVDQDTYFDDNQLGLQNISDLAPGSIVEVSGHSSGDGQIWATRIEVKDDSHSIGEELEVKGLVSNLSANGFMLGDLQVVYANSMDDSQSQNLMDGAYVEVESLQGFDANGALIANEVKLYNQGQLAVSHSEWDDEVELQGILTDLLDSNTILVNGKQVLVTANTRFEHGSPLMLNAGVPLEVEGYVNQDNQFVATKIEFEDSLSDDDNENDYEDDDDDNEHELENEDDHEDDDDRDDD